MTTSALADQLAEALEDANAGLGGCTPTAGGTDGKWCATHHDYRWLGATCELTEKVAAALAAYEESTDDGATIRGGSMTDMSKTGAFYDAISEQYTAPRREPAKAVHLVLDEATTFHYSGYETAAWYTEVTVQPGRYEMTFEPPRHPSGSPSWTVLLVGTRTSAYFPSLLGGVPVGNEPQGTDHRSVGEVDTFHVGRSDDDLRVSAKSRARWEMPHRALVKAMHSPTEQYGHFEVTPPEEEKAETWYCGADSCYMTQDNHRQHMYAIHEADRSDVGLTYALDWATRHQRREVVR